MGVIQRQSIKFSSVNILGTIIGGLSMLYIYSLDDELYGFAQMLLSMAYLIIPFASFGISSVAVRFYRDFNNKKDNNGFLSLLLVLAMGTNLLFILGYYVFKEQFYAFVEFLKMDSQKLEENEMVILFLVFLLNLSILFTAFISNYRRIVVPTLLFQFGYKLYLPTIFLLTVFGYVSLESFTFLIPLFYVITLSLLVFYLWRIGGFSLSWNPSFYKTKIKSIRSYLMYSSLNSLGSSLTFRLDSVMIPLMLGYAPNGLYNKILFMSNTISMPTSGVNQVASPIISESLKDNDFEHIEFIYKKSSTNLFLLGSYIYMGMLFCLPPLFELSVKPSSFEGGIMLFVILGFGKLIDMLTGVNNAIISFSKHYRWNLGFILILGFSNLILNYYLIGEFKVLGAAMATAISLIVFNMLKLAFIYIKFNMHPFSISTLKTIILFSITFILMWYVDIQSHPIVEIVLNGLIITIISVSVAFFWKISEDANALLSSILRHLKQYITN